MNPDAVAAMVADLGNARRNYLSVADENDAGGSFTVYPPERRERPLPNFQGDQTLSRWHDITNFSRDAVTEQLPDFAGGQSHRAALKSKIAKFDTSGNAHIDHDDVRGKLQPRKPFRKVGPKDAFYFIRGGKAAENSANPRADVAERRRAREPIMVASRTERGNPKAKPVWEGPVVQQRNKPPTGRSMGGFMESNFATPAINFAENANSELMKSKFARPMIKVGSMPAGNSMKSGPTAVVAKTETVSSGPQLTPSVGAEAVSSATVPEMPKVHNQWEWCDSFKVTEEVKAMRKTAIEYALDERKSPEEFFAGNEQRRHAFELAKARLPAFLEKLAEMNNDSSPKKEFLGYFKQAIPRVNKAVKDVLEMDVPRSTTGEVSTPSGLAVPRQGAAEVVEMTGEVKGKNEGMVCVDVVHPSDRTCLTSWKMPIDAPLVAVVLVDKPKDREAAWLETILEPCVEAFGKALDDKYFEHLLARS